jgi:nucleotide-binding universal stress UspA family protein
MRTIVVGVDGSEAANAALEAAATEAKVHGAELRVVVVWQAPIADYAVGGGLVPFDDTILGALRDAATRIADDAVSRVRESAPGVECTAEVLEGEAAERLLERAAGADLVVVGRRGIGGFKRLVLGSVSDHLVRHAACPVLVVHEGGRSAS